MPWLFYGDMQGNEVGTDDHRGRPRSANTEPSLIHRPTPVFGYVQKRLHQSDDKPWFVYFLQVVSET